MAVLALRSSAAAQADADTQACAKRVAKGVLNYTSKFLESESGCPLDNLNDATPVDCATDKSTAQGLVDSAAKMKSQIVVCTAASLKALCPYGGKTLDAVMANATTGDASLTAALTGLNNDVYFTSYAPGCPRPTPPAPRPAQDCAGAAQLAISQGLQDLETCFSSCERSRLAASSGVPCVDLSTGAPAVSQKKLSECIAAALSDLNDGIARKCSDAMMPQLGCPRGATTIADLQSNMGTLLSSIAQQANLDMYHSECKGTGGQPGQIVPATVKLMPSGTTKQVACGATLDAAFFGADIQAVFTSDLICTGATTGTNGVVVAKSGVSLTGSSNTASLTGPNSNKYRTGTGILLAAGVNDVTISGFKAIQQFGVGVGDTSGSKGIVVQSSTVRRNLQAGIRFNGTARIDTVTADRNGIGFDLSGDNSVVKLSTAKRSTPAPGIGIRVSGLDVDGNGRAVLVNQDTIEQNQVGLVVEGGAQQVRDNTIRLNLADGVQVAATGAKLNQNSIKENVGYGVNITGTANLITSNRSDQNGKSGYLIAGTGNALMGNGSGTLTNNGNVEFGYLVTGANNSFDTNKAEANLGGGFSVQAATAKFKGNDASTNTGIGFSFTVGGSSLDTNTAEANTGAEYSIAPGNTDLGGNTANGVVKSFTAAGGTLE